MQASRPIVIIDEPQSVESDLAKAAIDSLNPLCTLRYSATHRNPYNLVYRLDPVRAYDLKLVKQIEVRRQCSDDADFNKPFVEVKSVTATKTKITAKLAIHVETADGPKREDGHGQQERHRSVRRLATNGPLPEGISWTEINAGNDYVRFTNGLTLYTGQTTAAGRDDVMTVADQGHRQGALREGIEDPRLLPEGRRLKVLSLFFIDRVANYYDQDGQDPSSGSPKPTQTISAARPQYRVLKPLPVEQLHNGYFAQSKKGMPKDTSGDDPGRR